MPAIFAFINISNSPPNTTLLPLEYMHEITSFELITFFPNHVIKHWPAVSARVLHDGWKFADISRAIDKAHCFHPQLQADQTETLIKPNSLRYGVHEAEHQFCDTVGMPRIHRSATTQQLITTPYFNHKQGELAPAWTVDMIAQQFIGDFSTLPSTPFSQLVLQAYHHQQACALLGLPAATIFPPCQNGSNPPKLPTFLQGAPLCRPYYYTLAARRYVHVPVALLPPAPPPPPSPVLELDTGLPAPPPSPLGDEEEFPSLFSELLEAFLEEGEWGAMMFE